MRRRFRSKVWKKQDSRKANRRGPVQPLGDANHARIIAIRKTRWGLVASLFLTLGLLLLACHCRPSDYAACPENPSITNTIIAC
jgi:hypothetical protein